MAFEAYLELKGIKGESQREHYADHIEIMSFDLGAQNDGKAWGSGRNTGTVQVNDFTFTKKIDQATPLLFQYCCKGDTFDEAVLKVVKSAGADKPLEYIKYKFTKVLIAAIHSGAVDPAQGIPTETVMLNYGKCEIDYQPQGSDGKPKGGPIHGGWDIEKGKAA